MKIDLGYGPNTLATGFINKTLEQYEESQKVGRRNYGGDKIGFSPIKLTAVLLAAIFNFKQRQISDKLNMAYNTLAGWFTEPGFKAEVETYRIRFSNILANFLIRTIYDHDMSFGFNTEISKAEDEKNTIIKAKQQEKEKENIFAAKPFVIKKTDDTADTDFYNDVVIEKAITKLIKDEEGLITLPLKHLKYIFPIINDLFNGRTKIKKVAASELLIKCIEILDKAQSDIKKGEVHFKGSDIKDTGQILFHVHEFIRNL